MNRAEVEMLDGIWVIILIMFQSNNVSMYHFLIQKSRIFELPDAVFSQPSTTNVLKIKKNIPLVISFLFNIIIVYRVKVIWGNILMYARGDGSGSAFQ